MLLPFGTSLSEYKLLLTLKHELVISSCETCSKAVIQWIKVLTAFMVETAEAYFTRLFRKMHSVWNLCSHDGSQLHILPFLPALPLSSLAFQNYISLLRIIYKNYCPVFKTLNPFSGAGCICTFYDPNVVHLFSSCWLKHLFFGNWIKPGT